MASRPTRDPNGKTPRGLASRAGMWSAQHRKTAIWGWLAFVVIALLIGNAVGTKTLQHNESGVGDVNSSFVLRTVKHTRELPINLP